MAIQMRRGLRQDFDPTQMVAGEWAVSVDSSTSNQIVWMCFGAGVVKRMGTYEDFQAMIEEITDDIRDDMETILGEVQTLADAVGDDKDAVATMKTAIEQTDMPAIQDYVTTCQTSAQNASLSASNASGSATQASTKATEAQSWAVGGTGTRQGEDTNNAKYWSERAQSTSLAQSDWTENDDTDPSYIAHKPFKTIGSGLSVNNQGVLSADGVSSYNDLSDKPQINGNTLTGSKTSSQLGLLGTNDVPAWAKSPSKPTYTAEEVGALPDDTPIMEYSPFKTSLKKNLIDLSKVPYRNTVIANYEVDFNDDNSLTVNGDLTASSYFRIVDTTQDNYNLRQNGTFVISADFDEHDTDATIDVVATLVGSSELITLGSYPSDPEFTITDESLYSWISVRFVSHAIESFTDFTFNVMLRDASIEDDEITPFVPDNVELSNNAKALKTEVAVIENYGAKNLLKIVPLATRTEVINGITFTINDDETVTLNGTATANTYFTIAKNPDIPANTPLILSGTPVIENNNSQFGITYWKSGSPQKIDWGYGVEFQKYEPESGADAWLQIYVKNGAIANNLLYKPMIRLAIIEDDTYVPYGMSNSDLTQSLNGFMFDEDSQTGKGKYSMDGGTTWQNFSEGTSALNFTMTRAITSSNLGGAPVTIDNSDGQYSSMTIVITTSGSPSVVGLQAPTGRYTTVGTYTADISTYASLEFQILRYSGSVSGTINFACTITLE